eukprot:gene15543-21635_t
MEVDPSDYGSRKRPAQHGAGDLGDAKRQQSLEPMISLRVVCPNARSGSVIGKGGDVIRGIRESTGARVKVEEGAPGSTERTIVVTSKDTDPGGPSSPAQEAVAKIIRRIFEDDTLEGEPSMPDEVELKLLIDSAFIGIILGKGGESVTRIRSTAGCAVTIVNQNLRSPLARPEEDMIKMTGSFDAVQQAALLICGRIREGLAKGTRPSTPSFGANAAPGGRGPAHGHTGAPSPYSDPNASVVTEYRLLVPDTRIGPIIGKGGEKLKAIRDQTRAEVKVDRVVADCTERLVVCSSTEAMHSEWCGAAEALMMAADRVIADKIKSGETATVRLLAPSNQMGAVLGMKGATIRQLSADTGCKVVVLNRNQTPAVGSQKDEMSYGPGAFAARRSYQDPPSQAAAPQAAQYYPPADLASGYLRAPPPQTARSEPPPQQYSSYISYSEPPQTYTAGTQVSDLSGGPVYTQGGESYNAAPPAAQTYASYSAPTLDTYGGYQGPPATNHHQSYSYNEAPPPAATSQAAPNLGSLLNPVISSEGLTPGMVRYTITLPTSQIGTLLGARGSNISAIRLGSGAKIKVSSSESPNADREVEMTGTPGQVSHATSMAQNSSRPLDPCPLVPGPQNFSHPLDPCSQNFSRPWTTAPWSLHFGPPPWTPVPRSLLSGPPPWTPVPWSLPPVPCL